MRHLRWTTALDLAQDHVDRRGKSMQHPTRIPVGKNSLFKATISLMLSSFARVYAAGESSAGV